MTLGELMAVFDNGTAIQICKEDNWNDYDSFAPNSKLLKQFVNAKVLSAAAIDVDEIRVDIQLVDE